MSEANDQPTADTPTPGLTQRQGYIIRTTGMPVDDIGVYDAFAFCRPTRTLCGFEEPGRIIGVTLDDNSLADDGYVIEVTGGLEKVVAVGLAFDVTSTYGVGLARQPRQARFVLNVSAVSDDGARNIELVTDRVDIDIPAGAVYVEIGIITPDDTDDDQNRQPTFTPYPQPVFYDSRNELLDSPAQPDPSEAIAADTTFAGSNDVPDADGHMANGAGS